MSTGHVPRSESADGPPTEVGLINVPPTSKIRVLFLSSVRGLHTHYHQKHPIHCPGLPDCPGNVHRSPIVWKGYVAVEAFASTPPARWLPGVLEVTHRLYIHLGHDALRGEVWDLYRRVYRGTTSEVYGEHVRDEDPRAIRNDIEVEPVAARLYKTSALVWDRDPPFAAPQVVHARMVGEPVQVADPPASKAAPIPYDPRMRASMREMMIRVGAMLPADDAADEKGGRP